MKAAKLEGNVLFVMNSLTDTLALSIRNLSNVDLFDVDHINPANLISFDHILVDSNAVKKLEERLNA